MKAGSKTMERTNELPPFQDLTTLARNICAGKNTIERWVKQGIFPKPKRQGGKRLWCWNEVEQHLGKKRNPRQDDAELIARITNGTRAALAQKDNWRNVRRYHPPVHRVSQVCGPRADDADHVRALAQDRPVAGKPGPHSD